MYGREYIDWLEGGGQHRRALCAQCLTYLDRAGLSTFEAIHDSGWDVLRINGIGTSYFCDCAALVRKHSSSFNWPYENDETFVDLDGLRKRLCNVTLYGMRKFKGKVG